MADSPTPSSAIASDWELWKKLLSMGSTSDVDSRELAIEQAREAFATGIIGDPAYQAEAIVDGAITPIVASRTSTLECDIKATPGTELHIGDIVECIGEKWIIVELYADKVGILNGKMWLCNDTVRFQNHSANVITRYCVIDDGSYSRKTSDPIAYVPVNTYKLYVPLDADTAKMYIDKRLAFGYIYAPDGTQVLEVYKIVGIDLKSKNFGDGSHLMVVSLQRDVYNDVTDDFDNMLCDRYVENGDTPTPTPSGSCVVFGRDAIRIGTARQYTAVFTDAHGEVIPGITPIWDIDVPSGVSKSVSSDGTVTIEVPFRESLIGSEIAMILSESSGDYGTFEKKVGVITIG